MMMTQIDLRSVASCDFKTYFDLMEIRIICLLLLCTAGGFVFGKKCLMIISFRVMITMMTMMTWTDGGLH